MRVSLAAGAALALLSAALVRAQLEGGIETADNEPAPEFHTMGSRYGRSDPHIQTRDAGMFLLPRYGKRMAVDKGGRPLLCEYTGLLQLYSCFNTDDR